MRPALAGALDRLTRDHALAQSLGQAGPATAAARSLSLHAQAVYDAYLNAGVHPSSLRPHPQRGSLG